MQHLWMAGISFFLLSLAFSFIVLPGQANAAGNDPVPPISRCNQAETPEKVRQCKDKYRDCNNLAGPINHVSIAECKRDVIDRFTGGLGCQMEAGGGDCTNPSGGGGGATTPAQDRYQCGNLSDKGRNVSTKFNFGCLGEKGPTGLNPILDIVYALIRFASVGAGIAIVIAMIMAGIQYSAAEGKPDSSQKAKLRIQQAVIGLAIYIFAFSILQFLIPGGIFKP